MYILNIFLRQAANNFNVVNFNERLLLTFVTVTVLPHVHEMKVSAQIEEEYSKEVYNVSMCMMNVIVCIV